MNLENKTIIEIRKILQDYQNKQADINFFNNIIEILNNDILFSKDLKLITENSNIEMSCNLDRKELGSIYINYYNTCKKIKSDTLNFLDGDKEKYIQIFNYFCLFYIFHECCHVIQCYWAYYLKNEYTEINEMYKYLIDKLNNSSYFQIIYEIKRMKFFHERNANLLAFNCLNNVYSEDKIILMINYEYYVYHLFNAYNFKKQITPVEYTYKLVNKKCKINTKNFNYEDIILHGLPMDDEEWVQFLKMYDIYQNNHDIFYVKEEIDNRLKKVKK